MAECVSTPLPQAVRAKWAAPRHARTVSAPDIEARLQAASGRREELKRQLVEKAKDMASCAVDSDEDRLEVLKRLQEKLVAAQLKREKELEAVRARAASKSSPLTHVVAKSVEQRAEETAQKLQQSLEAAEQRRQARLEAAKERLSAAHEVVASRMVDSRNTSDQEGHRRIDSRLTKAEEARRERLAAVAGKAGDAVKHARQVAENARIAAEEEAQRQYEQLQGKLAAAEQRRGTVRRWSTDSGSDIHVA
jgi:colicin import membrane protein